MWKGQPVYTAFKFRFCVLRNFALNLISLVPKFLNSVFEDHSWCNWQFSCIFPCLNLLLYGWVFVCSDFLLFLLWNGSFIYRACSNKKTTMLMHWESSTLSLFFALVLLNEAPPYFSLSGQWSTCAVGCRSSSAHPVGVTSQSVFIYECTTVPTIEARLPTTLGERTDRIVYMGLGFFSRCLCAVRAIFWVFFAHSSVCALQILLIAIFRLLYPVYMA